MAASATDMFTKVGTPGTATTLSAPGHAISGTSITVVSTVNWPTTTGAIFAIDTVSLINGVETRDVGSYTEWEGVVASGTSITGLVLRSGTDQVYPAGATTRVYIPVAGSQNDRMVTGLVVSHNQDGTMITALPLTSPVLTTPKVVTSINDSAGNEIIRTPATASAVNDVTITNAATGTNPIISATGDDSAINLNLRGKGLAKTVTIGAGATKIYLSDYVSSGCVWTGDSYGSTRAASMTSGVVVINGNPITVAAVTARTFTASKDTYVDVLDAGDGTGTVVYSESNNNAASQALAANSVRIATVVTAAGSIAASTSIGQGGYANTAPVISSQVFKGFDSLGNKIYPKGPITPAVAQNPYMFRVYLAASQTGVADAVTTKVAWDTKTFDTGNNFDVTTNRRFTAPVSGFYQINATLSILSPGNTMVASLAYLYKNGANIQEFGNTYPNVGVGNQVNVDHNLSTLIQLVAGDYLEIFGYGDVTTSTVTFNGGAAISSFSGYLVSAS